MSLTPIAFSLRKMIEEIGHLFQQKTAEKGLRFETVADASIPETVVLDEARVRQILVNLVSNAVKFTDSGSVALRAAGVPSADAPDTLDVTITVADTGNGDSGCVHEQKLFDTFEQPPGQDHAKYGGTGLGLAISQKVAKLMNGVISARSNPDGKGTVIT
jgi:signal transduction histidine kinase